MPTSTKDGNGNTTSIDYDTTGIFASKITHPKTGSIAHIDQYEFDSTTGSMLSHTDENSQATTYSYVKPGGGYDPFSRATLITLPATSAGTATEIYTYTDTFPWTVSSSKSLDGTRQLKSTQVYDGLGRADCAEDLSASTSVETTYDFAGRPLSVTNPHPDSGCGVSQSSNTQSPNNIPIGGPPVINPPPAPTPIPPGTTFDNYERTTFTYDALGRKILQSNPDSTTQNWSYTGNAAAHTDEALNTTTHVSDALGRLIEVDEPGGATTKYTYSALGDLTAVAQAGVTGETARMRSFTYDTLSRLITSLNPETGTVCYGTLDTSGNCGNGYDANGNLLTKTDARGAAITYAYDALNRLTAKSRSGGSTDEYKFDGEIGEWAARGLLGANLLGRLSFIRSYNLDLTGGPCNINGTRKCDDQYFGYDAIGRPNHWVGAPPSEWGSVAHSVGAQYDLAGDITSLSYPDGRTVLQVYDSAGRLQSITDGAGQVYASGLTYQQDRSLQTASFGNGLNETVTQNSRLQACRDVFNLANRVVLDRRYFFGSDNLSGKECASAATNNGNIRHIMDGLSDGLNSQHYTYDALNRITKLEGITVSAVRGYFASATIRSVT